MREDAYGLAAVAMVALAACTPSTEKTTAAPPMDTAATSLAGTEHVAFEPGATVMVLAGTLGAGQTARYVLGAHEGDLLMAHALSPGEDLRVSVQRLDEDALLPDAAEAESYWAGRLPATAGYLVEVHGAGEEGRTLDTTVASEGDAVRLTVHGALDGRALADWKAGSNVYRGEIPRTQDCVFRLDPGAEPVGFELSVAVE